MPLTRAKAGGGSDGISGTYWLPPILVRSFDHFRESWGWYLNVFSAYNSFVTSEVIGLVMARTYDNSR